MKKIFLILASLIALNAYAEEIGLPEAVILPIGGYHNALFVKSGDDQPENDQHYKWFTYYRGIECLLATGSDGLVGYVPKDVLSPFVHKHTDPRQITNIEKFVFENCVRANVVDRALTANKAIEAGLVKTANNAQQAELALTTPHAENGLEEDGVLEGTTPRMENIDGHKIWVYEDILIPAGGEKGQILGVGTNALTTPQKSWVDSTFLLNKYAGNVVFGLDENKNQVYIPYPKKLQTEAFDWSRQYINFPLFICIFGLMVGFIPNLTFMGMVLMGYVVIKDGKLAWKRKKIKA